MASLFGYRIEPDFDLARENRATRIGHVLIGAVAICCVYDLFGGGFSRQVFQGTVATILSYGTSFYAERKSDICGPAFWKALVATLPIHVLCLVAIFYFDKIFPPRRIRGDLFIPVLVFGIESAFIFERIIAYFAFDRADPSLSQRRSGLSRP